MQSLTLRTHVGRDGILKLKMPIGMKNTDLQVVLVIQPVEAEKPAVTWPANFFTEIIGGWEGAPLVREPQGNYETRSDLKTDEFQRVPGLMLEDWQV